MIIVNGSFTKRWKDELTFEKIFSIKGEIYRAVANRKTLRFELDGKGFFVKLHLGAGWREIFKNLLQGRLPVLGAKNEYLAIKKLNALGVETMTLCAYGCRGGNPAHLQSFVITEALENTVSLEDYCQEWPTNPPTPQLKRALIRRVAEITRIMHENGINHRDLYICHFLLEQDFDALDLFHLYLIDLHRVQIRKKTPIRWKIKDIAALYFSSLDIGLTQRDLVRFIKYYRGSSYRAVLIQEHRFWARVRKRAFALYRR